MYFHFHSYETYFKALLMEKRVSVDCDVESFLIDADFSVDKQLKRIFYICSSSVVNSTWRSWHDS